jgi:hypothetical protein
MLFNSIDALHICFMMRQLAGEYTNRVTSLSQPGAFLIKHPLGSADHTRDGNVCNKEYVQKVGHLVSLVLTEVIFSVSLHDYNWLRSIIAFAACRQA